MTDYTYVAAYDLRDAMWHELQDSGLFDINDYYADGFAEPIVPIVPAQQVPELNNLLPGKTYIVYNVVQKKYGVQWWLSSESIILEIVSRNASEIQTITNFLIDVFRRYDLSARDINLKISEDSPFTFLWFNLESADPIQYFDDEGGYMSGDLSIGYAYTREVNSLDGRFA